MRFRVESDPITRVYGSMETGRIDDNFPLSIIVREKSTASAISPKVHVVGTWWVRGGYVVTQIWDAEKGRCLRFSKVRLADVFAVNSDALL